MAHDNGIDYSVSKDYYAVQSMEKSNWDFMRSEPESTGVKIVTLRDGSEVKFNGSKWESNNLLYSFQLNESNVNGGATGEEIITAVNNVFGSKIVSKVTSL
jgi:hypothetical protein